MILKREVLLGQPVSLVGFSSIGEILRTPPGPTTTIILYGGDSCGNLIARTPYIGKVTGTTAIVSLTREQHTSDCSGITFPW